MDRWITDTASSRRFPYYTRANADEVGPDVGDTGGRDSPPEPPGADGCGGRSVSGGRASPWTDAVAAGPVPGLPLTPAATTDFWWCGLACARTAVPQAVQKAALSSRATTS